MDNDEVVILRIDTREAVRSVADLRFNIAEYKKIIAEAEIGSTEYQAAVTELANNQNALRNAMNASTASLAEVTQSAVGLGNSYNALVNQMAQLRKAWRSTTDETTRANLGTQIAEINQRLKDMDSSVGDYRRNVGDYTNAVKAALADFPSFAAPARKAIDDVNKTTSLLAKNPLFAIITLLAPLLTNIVGKIKENDTAIKAINKATEALQPVFDGVTKVVEQLATWLSEAVDWFVKLLGESSGTFASIIKGAVGVGNTILQALVAPVKAAIEAVKGFGKAIGQVFKGDFSGALQSARDAGAGIGEAFRSGYDISANFAKGEEAAARFLDGLGSGDGKKKAKDAGKEAGKAFADGIAEELADIDIDAIFARADKKRQELYDSLEAANPWTKMQEDIDGVAVALEGLTAEEEAELAAEDAALAKMVDDQEKKAKAMQQAWSASVSAVSDVLGSLADIYEANADGSATAEKRIKGLRIASATISTLQGAIGAYMQAAANIPAPAGIIVGAAQAATVTAAGLAQIAKMRSTSLDGSSAPSVTSSSFPTAATAVSAPVQPAAAPASLATLANDTQILNRLQDQRVYILASDIEASDNSRRAQVAETSF